MQHSPACADLVKHFEGLHDGDLHQIGLQPKRCPADIWTEGWGHAIRDRQGRILPASASEYEALQYSQVRTIVQADHLLDQDLAKFATRVAALLRRPIAQHQFDALVSFAYNVGTGNLQKSTLLRKVNAGDHEAAEAEFGRWTRAGGKVLRGLVLRRRAEAWLYAGRNWRHALKEPPKVQPRP